MRTHGSNHGRQGRPFDHFAEASTDFVSRGAFFAACVLVVVIWAPSYFVFRNVDTWQLIINTATTIVTFLLVALLQNSQTRNDQATQHKLNAIADGLADLMEHVGGENEALRREVHELKLAVGLERHEGTTDNLAPPEPSHDTGPTGARSG